MKKTTIRIGTRKSKLALIQTELVKQYILKAFPHYTVEILPMSTQGDRQLEQSLASFGGKGVFTRELEEALRTGQIDFAVHSAKDMPADMPAYLSIGAVLKRANPQDVLVTTHGIPAQNLSAGSIIGTSSLRREIQIKQLNPTLHIKLLRGNVPTRLAKLQQGEYDGILLAAAGLERLGLTKQPGLFFEYLDTDRFVPAPGQGILAVVARTGEWSEVLRVLHCPATARILEAERTFMTLLGAGCNAPCGAFCQEFPEGLSMNVMYAQDGLHPLYQTMSNRDIQKGVWLASQLAASVTCQKVSLVGAGPGDEALLSTKALDCIRTADVILYDNLISPSLLNEARLEAQLIYAGKRSSSHHLPQSEIHQQLVKYALAGHYVVRLKGGDPFIFGRGGEEALVLAEHGIPFEIVPGISSAYSVPAYAGIPVTHRMMASSVHIVAGHEGEQKRMPVVNYPLLAKEEGTLVFLMGLHNLDYIAKQLIQHGKDPNTLAAVIQHGTSGRQKIVTATLHTIFKKASQAGLHTPAITVIGQVVSLHKTLNWFSKKPLSGTRTLLTGTRRMTSRLKEVLKPLGTETIALSLIETKPTSDFPDWQIRSELSTYSWIVFTSSFGIELFFNLIKLENIDIRSLATLRFAVIGSTCQETLKQYGLMADYVPKHFNSHDFAASWVPTLSVSDRVLIMRAKEGSTALPAALTQAGIAFDDIPFYETVIDQRRADELNRMIADIDYIIVGSGSAATALYTMLEDPTVLEQKVISIGPETSRVLNSHGIKEQKTAAYATVQGIADTLLIEALEHQHKST